MLELRILSIHVGMPQEVELSGVRLRTAIEKHPVEGPVMVRRDGLEGDAQADLKNHGRPDKAVCAYSHDHYPHWSRCLGRSLPLGSFGENLTLAGLAEDRVHIGDVFRCGEVELQVTQPRGPCHKLAKKLGQTDLPQWIIQHGSTGCYFRVLREGSLQPGDLLQRVQIDPARITVSEANRIWFHDRHDRPGIERVLAVEALSEAWRQGFQERLCKLESAEE